MISIFMLTRNLGYDIYWQVIYNLLTLQHILHYQLWTMYMLGMELGQNNKTKTFVLNIYFPVMMLRVFRYQKSKVILYNEMSLL